MALNYGYRITIAQNGQLTPYQSSRYAWQRKTSGSSQYEDLLNETASTYVVKAGDKNSQIRLKQVFSNGQTLFSNSLQVTNSSPPDPWEDEDVLYHLIKTTSSGYIQVNRASKVYKITGEIVSKEGGAYSTIWRLTGTGEYIACGKNITFQNSTAPFALGNKTNTRLVTSFSSLFASSPFNASISYLNSSNVADFSSMFYYAPNFNQSVTNLVGFKAQKLSYMFESAVNFNSPVNSWNVSNVTEFRQTFARSGFNQPLNNWNTSKAITMQSMFDQAKSFNQATVAYFDTGNVTHFGHMFSDIPVFNVDIGGWDVSSATMMEGMFKIGISFDRNLRNWCVTGVTSHPTNFKTFGGKLSASNMPCWGNCGCP